MAQEKTLLVAELDCLRRESAELAALRLHTQELAEVRAWPRVASRSMWSGGE